MWNFYTVLLQIHSGNCLQKIGILDPSSIKLLQNEQGCNFFVSQCRSTSCGIKSAAGRMIQCDSLSKSMHEGCLLLIISSEKNSIGTCSSVDAGSGHCWWQPTQHTGSREITMIYVRCNCNFSRTYVINMLYVKTLLFNANDVVW